LQPRCINDTCAGHRDPLSVFGLLITKIGEFVFFHPVSTIEVLLGSPIYAMHLSAIVAAHGLGFHFLLIRMRNLHICQHIKWINCQHIRLSSELTTPWTFFYLNTMNLTERINTRFLKKHIWLIALNEPGSRFR
jgi:hypothetical protein